MNLMCFKYTGLWCLAKAYTHVATIPKHNIEHFHRPRKHPCAPCSQSSPTLCPKQPLCDFECYRLVLPVIEFYVSGLYSMYSLVSGFFCLARFLYGSSFVVFYSFVLLIFYCLTIPKWGKDLKRHLQRHIY